MYVNNVYTKIWKKRMTIYSDLFNHLSVLATTLECVYQEWGIIPPAGFVRPKMYVLFDVIY